MTTGSRRTLVSLTKFWLCESFDLCFVFESATCPALLAPVPASSVCRHYALFCADRRAQSGLQSQVADQSDLQKLNDATQQ
jgi:hypothetical protein